MAKKEEVVTLDTPWEREESKVVRPFKSADDYLKDTQFRLYSDVEFDDRPVLQVDSIERARLAPSVQITAPPKDLEDLVGVGLEQLTLLVSIEDRVFKHATVVHSVSLDKVVDSIIELADACEAASWAGDTRIHVSAVLAKNRKAAAGLAQRAGSWISRKTFHITRTRDNATFNIMPVDEEWFRARGLPPSTTYYVEMMGTDFNQSCDDIPDLVKVYISKTLHAALARNEDSMVAKAIIKSIYVDVVTSIVSVGFANLPNGAELLPDSILSVVSTRLMKTTGVPQAKLMQYAKEGSGTQLQAFVQAEAELTRTMLTASGRRAA